MHVIIVLTNEFMVKEEKRMCTGFVRKGKDMIVGFNMDINIGAYEYEIVANKQAFYVEVKNDIIGNLKAQGVNHLGNFANQLNNLNFTKAPFKIGDDVVPLYDIVNDYIAGSISYNDIFRMVNEKEIVNMPTQGINVPCVAMHSIISDRKGNIMIIEPGNGYSVIKEKYAALSNFTFLESPAELIPENYGYYGKDRYDKAMAILRESNDDFSVREGLALLNAVKQEGTWATRVSFVYSYNENAVYYVIENDFDHVIRQPFEV